jgi:hypothetical protein
MDYIISNGELYHYGTRGMKWGKRLYQNKDGTLTPLGKKRYAKTVAKLKEQEKVVRNAERTKSKLEKLKAKEDELAARKKALKGDTDAEVKPAKAAEADKPTAKKSVKNMTDKELNDAITRLQNEVKYRDLTDDTASKGRRFVKKTTTDVIVPAAVAVGKVAATVIIARAVNKIADGKFKISDPDLKPKL